MTKCWSEDGRLPTKLISSGPYQIETLAPVSPTKEELREIIKTKDAKIEKQKSKTKVLQQKVRRKTAKIQKDLIGDMKEKGLLTLSV